MAVTQAGRPTARGLLPRTTEQVVALVLVLGGLATALLWWLAPRLSAPSDLPTSVPAELVALFVLLAAAGELVSVRIRRGDTSEDLTFLEAVLVAAVLTMPPFPTMASMLAGLVVASLVQRRHWTKTLFNVGSYATSTAAMILLYYAVDAWLSALLGLGTSRFGIASILALTVATLVFALINVALLSLVFHVVDGVAPRDFIPDEWRLSASMAIGGVGVGTTAVYLAVNGAWALLPFVALPMLALWFAYGAAAAHVEAQQRNRWLVSLGGSLAQHGRGEQTLREAVEAIRQIVGAPELAILDPAHAADLASARVLASLRDAPGPRQLDPEELPNGWSNGVVIRLDLGADEAGALLLGATTPYRASHIPGRSRGWVLPEADAPVLGALVAAVGSAMRAGAAFDALTEETAKLSAVVDNTSDGIAVVDDVGTIRLWSQTMARMTGVAADALARAPSGLPTVVRRLVEASRRASTGPVHVHLVRADGEELDVSLTTVRVREATAASGADSTGWVSILTVHDETRERRVERMKTDFVATISHELRTPITPIKGYAHLLASRGDRISPEKRAAALQVISDRADHLSRLVDDLLLASQVSDAARLAIEMGIEEVGDVVREAVASFPQMASRIELHLPEEPVLVQCDRIRAVQCLANLIGNAEKYAPADTPIEISVESSGMQAHISVRDHGSGIPAGEHEKVFERFYRREDPFTMRTGGTGLGLHIARELAVAMGGALTLRTPRQGTGAQFLLHLRTAQAPAAGDGQVARIAPLRVAAALEPGPQAGPPGSHATDLADTAGDSGDGPAADGTMDPRRAAM